MAFAARLALLKFRHQIVHAVPKRAVMETEDRPVNRPVGAIQLRLEPIVSVAAQPRRTFLALIAWLIVHDPVIDVITHARSPR